MTQASTHDSRSDAPVGGRVLRIEVWPRPGAPDARADALRADAGSIGAPVEAVRSARVYLIEAGLTSPQAQGLIAHLLENPVVEEARLGAAETPEKWRTIEVLPRPGVMDPAAQTVRDAIADVAGVRDALVMTGRRFDLLGLDADAARALAERLLANPVVHQIHTAPHHPATLPRGRETPFEKRIIAIRTMDDATLERVSRDAHLFLSLDEMRAIREEYERLGRDPSDIELETLAQTWSEHCVHKTLKSRIRLERAQTDADPIAWEGRPGVTIDPDDAIVIDNLLKSTVAAATRELIDEGLDWTLSVFVDNAGVIAFDEDNAVCVKVETHNHPSAIEPYGGAATGVGGCVRDILGTGLGARPIANTDVFCVAPPDLTDVPEGCLHPRRILREVVAGVRDYGNRMGIPTLSGGVFFDPRYVGNPLVYCGCVGVMPRWAVGGEAKRGDVIVAIGGRTGRDGIHGATFSSAELTDTHAEEFSHAVQIGNAIEEKKVHDAILRARDAEGGPLFSAITDCGAGGFSSAVGEMGAEIGAEVHLERAPLKYEGLTHTEIWISEAQERMVLSVSSDNLGRLKAICDEEGVELATLGTFGTPDEELILIFHAEEVGRLRMAFLHEGLPTPQRDAAWTPRRASAGGGRASAAPPTIDSGATLLKLLAHPTIASKRWIVRQYDHEVQGATAVKPLVGPGGEGPGDASVIEPVPGSGRALAIGAGMAPRFADPEQGGDAYWSALACVDECVRNLVCVGADPARIAILDNFCWPACGKPENLGSLVRAGVGCYDAAKAYRTPFISGKDSLNNQFTTRDGRTIEIPPTLLISGVGVVPDVDRCVTSDAKRDGSALVLVGRSGMHLGGAHVVDALGLSPGQIEALGGRNAAPATDLAIGPASARAVARAIEAGLVLAAHDCSEGGLLVAIAEMLIGAMESADRASLGAAIDLTDQAWMSGASRFDLSALFGENTSRYALEIPEDRLDAARDALGDVPHAVIGRLESTGRLRVTDAGVDLDVVECARAWIGTLDW